ncbi:MAG: hypothetical protein JWQ96_87 [Segetibacter sp.]|nr:hypothetical protein [Segetibacter sp.]
MSTSAFQIVCFGETLFDIIGEKQLPGGAPMNVAYHLKRLGLNPAIISKVGTDELGRSLLSILKSYQVSTDFIQVDSSNATGKVFAELQDNHEVVYDIVKPVAWDFIDWKDALAALVSEARFFVFGSLAARSEQSKKTLFKLLNAAKTKVLDINLRPPHYNKPFVEELLATADILKLNLAELELMSSWFRFSGDESYMLESLQDKFDLETIIVTKGGDGAAILTGNTICHHKGFTVKVADTVGSGDAFLAGYLSKHSQNSPADEALEFACATGALIASYNGACPDYPLNAINELIRQGN